jgi:hypothetical protein
MQRSNGITKGVVAGMTGGLLVATGVILFSATVVADRIIALQLNNAHTAAVEQPLPINRDGKSDAMSVAATRQQESVPIKTVEVVGVRSASIVYRDRAGNILFQTDPLANVTVVTKNVELPEVTIRESDASMVERVPLQKPKPETRDNSKRPHGCESAFARPSPEPLTRLSSRCITELFSAKRMADLRRATAG